MAPKLGSVAAEKQYVQFGLVGTERYKLMISNEKKITRKIPPEQSARMVETIVGCKWSLTVYQLLAAGIHRPGQMVRSVDGLSTKVLNACLKRNVEFGILERVAYNEVPPRVEYRVTPFGERFLTVIGAIEALQAAIDADASRVEAAP